MISTTFDSAAAQELAGLARFAAERGWVPATSGNFSRRIDGDHVAVTRSGADKSALNADDFIVVDLRAADLPPGVSAEAPLHVERYRSDAGIGAIAHVHTVASTVLSRHCADGDALEIAGYEMQKALAGIATHAGTIRIPVFANDQDTGALAVRIERALQGHASVPGYLLAGHGFYAWGATVAQARRHMEGLEFLLCCSLEERRLGR